MELLTQELKRTLPQINEQDGLRGDAVVHCKFFDPCGSWTWYVLECSGIDSSGVYVKADSPDAVDHEFMCIVDGFEVEMGPVMLSELSSTKGPLGLGIERDIHWKAGPAKDTLPESVKKEMYWYAPVG